MRSFSRFALFLKIPLLSLFLAAGLLVSACRSKPLPQESPPEAAPTVETKVEAVPTLLIPQFHVTEIAILKAELINTRFRVNMRIDNPNSFPLELSAFSYTLFGNGMLWADGTDRNVFTIPAESSTGARLFLLMNFIDMDRNLLDQIINLVDVNYRFTGTVQVSPNLGQLPPFSTGFDLSGYSRVLEEY